MDTPHLRPTFVVPLRPGREEAIQHIRARLNETVPDRWVGKGRWAEIHVPGDEQRIWSPHLSLRLDRAEGTDGCTLFARFAPRAEIWTGVVFLYAAIAFAVILGGIFGYVQWASNESPWGLWAVWLGAPALAGIHGLGAIGRRLSREQMIELRERMEPAIEAIRADTEATSDG